MNNYILNIKAQQDNFNNELIDYKFRINALKKLKQSILNYEQDIYNALLKDLNKSYKETFLCEINEIILEIEYHINHLKKWMKPKKVNSTIQTFLTKSYIFNKPKNKVLIIAPFNYPINLTFMPLIGAISAGCKILLKTSPFTVNTNLIIKKIIEETFNQNYISYLDEKQINNYNDLYLYEPNLIFFTGSTKIGKIIESECIKRNIEYITELGGLCPCVVNDIKHNIVYNRIVWAKFLNAGQTCVSINYLLYNSKISNFKDYLIKSINKQFHQTLENQNIVKIINQNEFNRLLKIIKQNKKNIIFGGNYNQKAQIIEPTVISLPISKINKIKQYGEIFGPILFIIEYSDEQFNEILKHINKINNSPLAAYLISNNKQKIKQFINNINAGSYCINDAISQILNHHLPFGGVYDSGFGKYHGYYSFLAFSWQKPILKNNCWFDIPIKYINNQFSLKKCKIILNIFKKVKK